MTKKLLLPILMMLVTAIAVAQTTRTVASGNWSDAAIWDNGVPSSSIDAIVLHDVTVDVNASVLSLTVGSPTGSLTNSNRNLDIYGDLTVSDPSDWIETNNGKTKIRNNSTISGDIYFQYLQVLSGNGTTVSVTDTIFIKNFLILTAGNFDVSAGGLVFLDDGVDHGNLGFSKGGELVGNYVWQINIDRCNEWSTYSAPVDATLAEIAADSDVDGSGRRMIYTGFPDSDFPDFNFVNTYFYDEATEYHAPTSTSNVLSRGEGYWYWNSDEVFNSDQPSIPQQWPIELVGTSSLSGTFDYGVSYGNTNWNLIGNPYPGVLDWNAKYWTKTNINDAVYYWNTCTQSYASYVGGVGSNGGERYIVAGQGFFVETNGSDPVLQSDQRILSNVDNRIVKSGDVEEDEEVPVVSIRLNGDETILTFDESATTNYDSGLDAKKLLAPSFVKSDMSSIKTVYNGINYSVNTIPFEDVIIPLDIKGEGKLAFKGAEQFDEVDIYVQDKLTGDIIDMKLSSSYTFTNDEYDFIDRFNIIVSKKSPLSVEDLDNEANVSLYPNPFSDELNIQVSGQTIDKVEVYNTLGKIVLSETKNSSDNIKVNVADLQSGVYIVKVYNNNEEIGVIMTQKI